MNQETLIRFKNASLGYGNKPVLTGVDFEVKAGAFLGILGHNGSGKTTLLKTLLGLIPYIKGQFSAHGAQGGLRYGYVPQKERLDPIYPLTAYEVAKMGAYRKTNFLKLFHDKDQGSLIHRCLKECGAVDLAHRRYSDLSGGQKQRVLIARALAAEPEVLVLDEPLAGIDATTQESLLRLFRSFKERHLTILMVSHRIRMERDLFTHIAWVDEGKVLVGPVEEMLGNQKLARVFQAEL